MKKIIYFAIMLAFIFTSCESEEEHPKVDTKIDNSTGLFLSSINTTVREKIDLGNGYSIEKLDSLFFIDGDVLLTKEDVDSLREYISKSTSTRGCVVFPIWPKKSPIWPNNKMYYCIPKSHPRVNEIREGLAKLHDLTGFKFIEHKTSFSLDKNILGVSFICDEKGGAYSYVGCQNSNPTMTHIKFQSISIPSWGTYGTVMHEVCHALGLYHEQCRTDRDEYITINWDNIIEDKKNNFDKKSGVSVKSDGISFDFNSIMLYDSYAFSKNGQPTMTKKDGNIFTSQRETLSVTDLQAIKKLYPKIY